MKTKSEYTNGEVTITWEPGRCIHCGNCANGLPAVFKPREKPWIDPLAASTAEIIEQVNKCPSGALGFYLSADSPS